jgi:VWFA-related protein
MKRLLLFACACGFIATPAAQEPDAKPNFSSESELVVLHVAVKDKRGGYVGGLGQNAFRVLENRRPQEISFFHNQDAPVTVGILIDSSGSMAPNRDMVIAASMAFSRAMNPQDEFFVLGFNEHIHTPLPADKPFTNFEPALRIALVQAIKARGQTAVYNAVIAGLDYVQKGGFERQVLIVLSDGGDNASRITREEVLGTAQGSNAVIYSIALVDPLDRDADPKFLADLSRMTGGLAFRPQNAREVAHIFQRHEQIAVRDVPRSRPIQRMPSSPATVPLLRMANASFASEPSKREAEPVVSSTAARKPPSDTCPWFIIAVARLTANSGQHVTADDLVRGGWWACAGPVARTSFVASSCVVSRPDDHQWLRSPGRGGPKTTGPFHVGGSPVQSQSLLQPYRRTANNQHDG